MDLQNMVFDFDKNEVFSMEGDVSYIIPSVSNMAALNTELDTEAGFTVAHAAIQLTEDQYGVGQAPRIVVKNSDETSADILLVSGLATATNTEIATARGEIEAEITNQQS